MQTLRFNYNWNNKLDCKCFTTFRIWIPNKFKRGEIIEVKLLKGKNVVKKFKAKMLQSLPCKLKDVPVFLAQLDTGYNTEEFKKLVKTMYKNKIADIDKQTFVFYLLEKV